VLTIGRERGLTEPKLSMTILFRKVGGLNVGAPVSLAGVNVGTVKSIDFLDKEIEGRGVKVTLDLFKKYKRQLYKSKRFGIMTEGVLGEKIIEIIPDPEFRIEDLSTPIIGEDPVDIHDLAETFSDAASTLLETSRTIEIITQEMKRISESVRRLLNRIEQRIIEGNLFKVF